MVFVKLRCIHLGLIMSINTFLLFFGRCAALAFVVFLLASPVQAARRALVIGNDSYQYIAELKNARADAKAMADALRETGFLVTLLLDQKHAAMKKGIRTFKTQLAGGDEVVFFYSGHGAQIGGTNYLLPVDLAGEDEEQVKDESIPLQRLLDDMQDQKVRFALALIDACRDNPFKGRGRNIGTRGLAPTSAADGQMIIFSAGTGQQALDRISQADRSPNGLFTRVFLQEMKKPGVPVHETLRKVRADVVRIAKSVNHQQTPAIYDQAVGNFFFVQGSKQSDFIPLETPVVPEPVPVATVEPVRVISPKPPLHIEPVAPPPSFKPMQNIPSF